MRLSRSSCSRQGAVRRRRFPTAARRRDVNRGVIVNLLGGAGFRGSERRHGSAGSRRRPPGGPEPSPVRARVKISSIASRSQRSPGPRPTRTGPRDDRRRGAGQGRSSLRPRPRPSSRARTASSKIAAADPVDHVSGRAALGPGVELRRRAEAGAFRVVAVEALTRLATEPAGGHEVSLDRRRPKSLGLSKRIPDGRCGGQVDVDSDQVHQLEGPQAGSPRRERPVSIPTIVASPRSSSAQGLDRERPVDPVDDEAGPIGAANGTSAPARDEGRRGPSRRPVSWQRRRRPRRAA